MTEALIRATELSVDWIAGLAHRPVASSRPIDQLQADFSLALPQTGMAAKDVIDELAAKAEQGLLGSAGGRFFAWVIGGGLESALAADLLVSTWDQNAALAACGPAASVIEDVAGNWIKELLNLPRSASFAFTTGCQLAHVTALAAARWRLLTSLGYNVNDQGLFGAPAISIITSQDRHGSVPRAARLLGFGSQQIVTAPSDDLGRMSIDGLRTALHHHDGSKIVILNAADLNIGAFDPFEALIPLAKEANAWVHIDGAFGLFARASQTYKGLTKGVELADSWATDGHKWLNVPFDCGIAIINDQEAHREAMTISASYVAPQNGARDQIDWNPEWSRRARGVPVYAALRELGAQGVEALVDRCCAHAKALVIGISSLTGAQALWVPTLNQGLIRFERKGHDDLANDAFTDEMIAAINATGEAFFSGTTWRGQRAMRVSVVNWRTNDDDVSRAIKAVANVLETRA